MNRIAFSFGWVWNQGVQTYDEPASAFSTPDADPLQIL